MSYNKLIENHERNLEMKFLLIALMVCLVSACSNHLPSKPAGPRHTLVLWTDDGAKDDYGKISGNAPSELGLRISKPDQLVQAVNNCVASYSVNREYNHTTIVSVDTKKLGLGRKEVVECVISRFSGHFNAAIGDPEALETFDDTLFTKFHARRR